MKPQANGEEDSWHRYTVYTLGIDSDVDIFSTSLGITSLQLERFTEAELTTPTIVDGVDPLGDPVTPSQSVTCNPAKTPRFRTGFVENKEINRDYMKKGISGI